MRVQVLSSFRNFAGGEASSKVYFLHKGEVVVSGGNGDVPHISGKNREHRLCVLTTDIAVPEGIDSKRMAKVMDAIVWNIQMRGGFPLLVNI